MKLWRLDAIRGALALYVVASHEVSGFRLLFSFGQEAVMGFFLLSGFVIRYSATPKLGWGFMYYLGKRAVRIYSVLVCMILVAAVLQKVPAHSLEFWKRLGGNLLMLQDFAEGKPNVIVPTIFSGALWSLHYEWWFYMLFFPVARYIAQSSRQHAVGIIGVLSAVTYVFWPYAPNRILLYFPIWWAGVVMAESYLARGRVDRRDLRSVVGYLIAIAGVLGLGCLIYWRAGGHFSPGLHPVLETRHVVGALLVIAGALAWQRCKWLGFSRVVGWGTLFAPISYALYVAHQPLMADASYLRGIVPARLEQALYLVILLLFSGFSELWVFRRLNFAYEQRFGLGNRNGDPKAAPIDLRPAQQHPPA